MAALDVRLKKVNKTYGEGDTVSGVVVIQSKGEQHNGIQLVMEGQVTLQLSSKSVGVFEAFYNSLKPIVLVQYNLDVAKPGKLPSGKTEIPFELPLKAKLNKPLYDTYHGVFVNIQYNLKCSMKRSLMKTDLHSQCEFIVECPKKDSPPAAKPVSFSISPSTLQDVKERANVPMFKIRGKLTSTVLNITQPFTGELVVESSEAQIKSIELQLVRVETCGCAEGFSRDSTEIQNIQIAEGNVCRGITLPIYMVFPRLFTCPTLVTSNFKIEFEVNIVVVFIDDHLITENFPITLYRN